MLIDDPIFTRIREARKSLSEKYNHDPKAIVEYYIKLQNELPSSRFKQSQFDNPDSTKPTDK